MELIDRKKLVSDFWKGVEEASILSYEDTDDLMENAPTVDAVEVVRCRDCKHRELNVHYCRYICMDVPHLGFFCAKGERKDNEKTD